jgi:hypothetical protein
MGVTPAFGALKETARGQFAKQAGGYRRESLNHFSSTTSSFRVLTAADEFK